MFVIIGWAVAMVCIFGVYIAHGGNISVILHGLPFEMITIFGAAIGAFLTNNQMKVVKSAVSGLGRCFKGNKFSKARYMELLALLYDMLRKARKERLMSIEKDVEDPHTSALFQKHPVVGNDHHVTEFITDYLRMMVSGNLNAHEIESLMDSEIDTVHHEHFSYLSLHTVQRIFESQGLVVWDVQTLPTHGGSLRVWAQLQTNPRAATAHVNEVLAIEAAAGMTGVVFYRGLQARMDAIKDDLLGFLIAQKRAGKSVAAYGAAAKGNTLLNYAGVRPDLLPYVVDASPHKQGRYLPGSRIPIVAEAHLRDMKPDYVLILPWNLRDEITAQLAYVREWDAKFVTAVPGLRVA